ncbi:PAN2-PAN3 deadenylation complex subunit PAN3 [Bienertia sinuspersici]
MHQSPCHEQIPVSRMFTSQKEASSTAPKYRAQRRGQMLAGDRALPKSKMASSQGRRVSSAVNPVNESKDFIALNRNVSRNRLRAPAKSDSSVEADKKFCTGKSDPLASQRSPVRKRRTVNASSRPVDNAPSVSPLLEMEKQRSNKVNIVTGNGARVHSAPVNQTCPRSRPANQRGNKNTDIVSFTFNSPVKTNIGSDETSAKRRDQNGSVTDKNLQQKLTKEESGVKKSSQNYLRMNGDALGALLEQKLKELSLQVENEAATGYTPSARTTASILQELISALTTEKPDSCEETSHGTDTQGSQCDSEVADSVFQAN